MRARRIVALLLLVALDTTASAKVSKHSEVKPWGTSQPNINIYHPQALRRLVSNTTIATEVFSPQQDSSEANNTCSICRGAELKTDFMPFYEPSDELPPNLTCGHWEQIAQKEVSPELCESSGIRTFYTQCCRSHVPVFTCEQNIRKEILDGYDPAVPPVMSHDEPLNITIRLEYQTVVTIDVQQGTSEIFFSVLMYWYDPRLAWEVDEDHCADHVTVFASMDREKTEIWVSDMDLYNQIEGVQNLPDTMALVYPDGLVVWHRNGGIKAFCQFTGVSQIPFDVLGCQLIMGPWVRTDPFQIKYHLWNGTGFIYGDFEPSYNEYYPVPDMAASGYSYQGAILYFNFFFQRSKNYYVFNLIVPTVILTYVSMGTFLLDLRVGERLSYGMALALVVVAQQINTGGMIPVSNERLWIDKFIGWSFYWVIVGLLESVFVGYLYFMREDMQSNIDNDEPENKRTRVIYDGMRGSVFVRGEGTGDLSTNSAGQKSEQWEQQQTKQQTEVDVDDWNPEATKSKETIRISNLSDDSEAIHATESRTTATPLTFKQHLQNTDPKQHMKKTATLRSVHVDDMQVNPCKVAKYWQWMYTISLRKLDRFFFFFTLTTYSVFLIAMLVSIPYWGSSVGDVWIDESTGSTVEEALSF